MGVFLNSSAPYENYKEIASDMYFVDKSPIIGELFPALGKRERHFCITRPRRFGKSVMADMIGAFFSRGVDSGNLFDNLAIAENKEYKSHLNRHHVIFMDCSRMPERCRDYHSYITRISDGIRGDLLQAYSDLEIDKEKALWDIFLDIFLKTKDKFIFVIDEWDAVFHMSFISEDISKSYLAFLKNLLKDQAYVELAYMTGVLPIAKYSSGSELNMFREYDMVSKKKFSEYFGFLDHEVDQLFQIYREQTKHPGITREELRMWYDGYYTAKGEKIYNPRSVVCALQDDEPGNYWTSSGPYDEIFYYIRNNVESVRDDLVLMISGEGVGARIRNYAAAARNLHTRDEIYSAMVVYGFLTYRYGKVFVPNREIMGQFQEMLMEKQSLGYVYRLAKESERMLKATLAGEVETMAEILKMAHDTEAPILSYNSEIELSAVVNLVYLAARDWYRVEREDKAGEGYVDFIFYPERQGMDGIILELKINSTPDEAIRQIKKKNYALRFLGKLAERPKYTGKILAVGISYKRKTKEHFCKVEVL